MVSVEVRKVGLKTKKPRLFRRGRKTTNYNPMNISNQWLPSGAEVQDARQINGREYAYVVRNQGLTNCSGYLRFSKSSQLKKKDLLSHLNLYNPMNISLGGNSFTTTVHGTKVQRVVRSANDIF